MAEAPGTMTGQAAPESRDWSAAAALVSPYVTPWVNLFMGMVPQIQQGADPMAGQVGDAGTQLYTLPTTALPPVYPQDMEPFGVPQRLDDYAGGVRAIVGSNAMPHPLMRPAAPPVIAPPVQLSSGQAVAPAREPSDPDATLLHMSSQDEDAPPTSQMHAEYLQRLQSYHDKYTQKPTGDQPIEMRGGNAGETNQQADIYQMMNINKPPPRPAASPGQAARSGPRPGGEGGRKTELPAVARGVPPILKTIPPLTKPAGIPAIPPLDTLVPGAVANRRAKLQEVYQLRKEIMRRVEEGTGGSNAEEPVAASTASHSWEPKETLQQNKTTLRTEGNSPPEGLSLNGQEAQASTSSGSGNPVGTRGSVDNLSPLVLRAKTLLLQSDNSTGTKRGTSNSLPSNELGDSATGRSAARGPRDVPGGGYSNRLKPPIVPRDTSVQQPIVPPGRHGRDARGQRSVQQMRREIMAGTLGQRSEGEPAGTAWRDIAIDESLKQMVPLFQGVVGAMRTFRQASAGATSGTAPGVVALPAT
eukprot:GHVS01052446.1.p1 GENE.GHVS01052446.1~~GHVS01052446.1.p1  ORF type:complete len:551 (+),score=66.91 GHVS01052446.1:69-1655(+)